MHKKGRMRASLASLDTKATSCFLQYFNDVELSQKFIFNSLIRAAMERCHMLLQLRCVSERTSELYLEIVVS